MLQSAALRMSHVVTPALEAAVVAAPRTECALKMAVSIPAFSSVFLSHRAIVVELEATLWGLIVVRNRGFDFFFFLYSSLSPILVCPERSHGTQQVVCCKMLRRRKFCQQLGLSGLFCQLGWLENHSLVEVSPEPQVQLGQVC